MNQNSSMIQDTQSTVLTKSMTERGPRDQTSKEPGLLSISRDSKLFELNFSRQKSENQTRDLIEQQSFCQEIRGVILGTLACSQRQIEEQKIMIVDLTKDNHTLGEINARLKMELMRLKKKFTKQEKKLYAQIKEQQSVRHF